MLKIFFSNKIDFLSHALSDFLLKDSKSLFSRKFLAIPCRGTKNFLHYHMAKERQIAIGVEFLFIEKAFKKVFEQLKLPKKLLHFLPETWDLPLIIDQKLTELLAQKNNLTEEKRQIFSPLFKILKEETLESNRRPIESLSSELASLFRLYNLYGEAFFKNANLVAFEDKWQLELFKEISQSLHINTAASIAEKLTDRLKDIEFDPSNKLAIFCFNFLPKPYFEICKQLSKVVDVHFYLFSPCMKFWADNLSDHELSCLIKKEKKEKLTEDLELYLHDRNPLLGNLGKIGKHWFDLLENETPYEAYFLNPQITEKNNYNALVSNASFFKEEAPKNHLLSHIQHDILLLRNPKNEEKSDLKGPDNSIEIHVCHNKLREVEVLHQRLLNYVSGEQKEKDPWQQSILIMAPDIEPYRPYIESVFRESQHSLQYYFSEGGSSKQQSLIEGFLQLLELSKDRFSKESFIHFISHPLVKKQLNFKDEQLNFFKKVINEASIHWGLSEEQQQQFLSKNLSQEIPSKKLKGSFLEALNHYLNTFIFSPNSAESFFTQSSNSSSILESPSLGQLAFIVEKLSRDLSPLYSNEEKNLDFWTKHLIYLLENYFDVDASGSAFEDAKDLYKLLQSPSKLLNSNLSSHSLSFDSFSTYLFQQLNKENKGSKQQGFGFIQCCSLSPQRAIPAKAIFLLGMSEANFPKEEQKSPLNLLKKIKESDYFPGQGDFDRYLFLETLLCAKDKIYFSFSPPSSENPFEEASPLLSDLSDYIDHNYKLKNLLPSKSIVYKHPQKNIDLSYFSSPTPMKNFESSRQRRAEKTLCLKAAERLIPEGEDLELPEGIEIQDLINLAKNPLAFFFKKNWDMYFQEEMQSITQESDGLGINALEGYWLKIPKEENLKDKWQQLSSRSSLFQNPITDALFQQFSETEEAQNSRLQHFHLSKASLNNLYLHPSFEKQESLDKQNIAAPPLKISLEGKSYLLQGKLPSCYSKGLVVFELLSKESLAKNLPLLAISSLLSCQGFNLEKGEHIFLKSKKTLELPQEQALEILKSYLKYYIQAHKTPSILYPSLVKSFFDNQEDAFSRGIKQIKQMHLESFSHSSFYWSHRNFPELFNFKQARETWLETYFSPFENYFNNLTNTPS
jgi:exodeoxyribonuclease V gamma subunit